MLQFLRPLQHSTQPLGRGRMAQAGQGPQCVGHILHMGGATRVRLCAAAHLEATRPGSTRPGSSGPVAPWLQWPGGILALVAR